MANPRPKSPKPNITPSGTNPIEEAIGERATENPRKKTPKEMTEDLKTQMQFPKEIQTEQIPQNPSEIPDVPSPQEMLTLEELNRQTEERLQDQYPEDEPQVGTNPQESITVPQETTTIPVSKPDPQPQGVVPSSPASPVETINAGVSEVIEKATAEDLPDLPAEEIPNPGDFKIQIPAEDVELTNLKKYILEDGFNEAAVAFHIVTLCAQPLVTTSTTTWAFKNRANIPEMVLALLKKGGYLEGIWPSLKIVMSDNAGNPAWASGVAMTIAFFDTIRILPVLTELENDS